jgi:hypothetical protein
MYPRWIDDRTGPRLNRMPSNWEISKAAAVCSLLCVCPKHPADFETSNSVPARGARLPFVRRDAQTIDRQTERVTLVTVVAVDYVAGAMRSSDTFATSLVFFAMASSDGELP